MRNINKLVASLKFRTNRIITLMYRSYIKYFGKANPKIILFYSSPDFSDNAKALCQFICKSPNSKNLKIYFIVNNQNYCKRHYLETGFNFIPLENKYGGVCLKNLKIMLTAGYILYTHGAPFPCEKKYAHKGQKYIKLWHGCGYKDNQVNPKDRVCNFDLALVPGELFVATKMKFWNAPEEKILASGYPRYDWLINSSEKSKLFAEVLRNKKDKMIIWMPTFRNDKNNHFNESDSIKQFPLISCDQQWEELDLFCRKENILLLIKLHQYQRDYLINFDVMSNIKLITNEDFNREGINMYEFLSQTDALISDYSSVAIDYLLVDKPIAFSLDDYEQYKQTRGFVFEDPLKYMPGHHLYSFNDLKSFINDVKINNDTFKMNRLEIRKKAIHESKCYCHEILQKLNLT